MVVERRTKHDLMQEVERLRARIGELESIQSNRAPGLWTAALKNVPVGVTLSAPGGTIHWVNPAVESMLGRTKDQIIGTALYDYWYHGYSESEMDKLSQLWTGEIKTYQYDRLLQRSDGKPFWADIRTSIITDPDNGQRWMLRTVEDAGERQQHEKDLRSQREQANTVLESISEGVCVFRGRQRLFVNRAFVELMGHANAAEALEGSPADFLPEDDRRRIERDEMLEPGRRLRESTARRADGRPAYCIVSIARTVFDGLPALVAVLRDVTLRMQARATIEAGERRYRSLFEAAPMGIAIVDEHAIIQDCNPALAAMAGMPVDDIKGTDLRALTALPPGRTRGNAFQRLAAGEIDTYEGQRLWETPNRAVEWVEFRNSAVRSPDGRFEYAISIARDITARKKVERQRQELYWRLAESKEEQSREIARELHDEIGQQLTGLRMQLERATPESIDSALEITSELMSEVRSLSLDLRPPALDDLGLVAALRSLINRFIARTGVSVEFAHEDNESLLDPAVNIAAFRIVQEALTNVARHAQIKEARVSLAVEDSCLVARIEDHGCGTTRKLGSTPGDSESTGLSGMYERALALGGDLRFASGPGEGTIVEAVLPLHAPAPATSQHTG